ncbi:hypothetical protein OH540_22415 [Streptomyces sp. BPPL-273]|uniref:hypothetical protein n=1 Tax=Streptomyces sp. BPPL-273 TaxID=2987533 RepID=UPI0024AF8DEA|nr:hypothetical protein [Streptomyces sp. BPPL-273]WHM32649.1 hypothetical protein OH540_22415 [Streptomyces sp. BPPL-273]
MTGRSALTRTVLPQAGAALVLLLLVLVVVRLPWIGDLGMHAATLQRLRHDLLHPGNPLVDADTPSPYYSPWTVPLGWLAGVTGFSVFTVLRIGAVVSLAVLVWGVWRYARTLSARPAVPPLALLALVLLWGTTEFSWSGFLGLHSLALTVAYPSVLALGLAFHLWTWLTRARGWGAWLGCGVLWAVILLVHQYSGIVASLGALAVVIGARHAGRRVWARVAGGLALGVAVLWVWPYYDIFALFGAGDGMDEVHRSLYRDLWARYWLVLVGVAALVVRWRRDRRDVLVLFFALGLLVFAAGWVSGHWSWGRVLPAVVIPAQLAVAVEVGETGRRVWAGVLGVALVVGAWGQVGVLGFAVGREALPGVLAERYREPWEGYGWITPWVGYGDVVMAREFPSRLIPATGAYTVAPGYTDFFLDDEGERVGAVRRYFSVGVEGVSGSVRRGIEREYGVRWVVDRGVGVRGDEGLRVVRRGPGGWVLYAVVG